MVLDRYKILMIISKILFWLLSCLAIYWIILKLTDHSPTVEYVLIAMMSITISGVFGIIIFLFVATGKVNKHMGKVENYIRTSDKRFFALASDFKKYCRSTDRRLRNLEKDVHIIKNDVKHLMK
jgi:glucan phosphoethanolaminetransferase (alkaline phosphatase superfamily)